MNFAEISHNECSVSSEQDTSFVNQISETSNNSRVAASILSLQIAWELGETKIYF